MQRIDGDQAQGAAAELVPAEVLVDEQPPSDAVRRRVQPHRLGDNRSGAVQGVPVGPGDRALGGRVVQLDLEPAPGLGVAAQLEPAPRQRDRRRLVPGQQQGQRLVAHLLARHGPALLVADREESAEQVVPAGVRPGGALLDKPLDHGVELSPCPSQRGPHRVRHPEQGEAERSDECGEDRQQDVEGAGDPVRVAAQVGAEEGLADDVERDRAHLVEQVDPDAVSPGARPCLSDRHRHHPVARHLLGREQGVDQPALPSVQVSPGGEQPVAEEELQGVDPPALADTGRTGQQVTGQARVADEDDIARTGPQWDEIPAGGERGHPVGQAVRAAPQKHPSGGHRRRAEEPHHHTPATSAPADTVSASASSRHVRGLDRCPGRRRDRPPGRRRDRPRG